MGNVWQNLCVGPQQLYKCTGNWEHCYHTCPAKDDATLHEVVEVINDGSQPLHTENAVWLQKEKMAGQQTAGWFPLINPELCFLLVLVKKKPNESTN